MGTFKINFQLYELDEVTPWGNHVSQWMHWFGLTDGLLWIDVGDKTIYEYSEAAKAYFDLEQSYNNYQISRFMEDFSETFWYIAEAIPEELYQVIDTFETKAENWKNTHFEDEDEVFDRFYEDEYSALTQWYFNRIFTSGHLVGGPKIGCFRCGDKIKIIWESVREHMLENGNSIWTSPQGSVELMYDEFVAAVTEFFDSFFDAMDHQIGKAIVKDWKKISIDKERLVEENEERKEDFYQAISFLTASHEERCKYQLDVDTDWQKVFLLYEKMENETKQCQDIVNRLIVAVKDNTVHSSSLYWYPLDELKNGIEAVAYRLDSIYADDRISLLEELMERCNIEKVDTVQMDYLRLFENEEMVELLYEKEGNTYSFPWYVETFYFDKSHRWLIYVSHEKTITFSGEALIAAALALIPEQYLYGKNLLVR